MVRKFGMSTMGVVLTLAGVAALGVVGYGMATGNTLCRLVGSCEVKSNTPAVVTASNTTECSKSCCELAKVAAASNDTSECAKACGDSVAVIAVSNEKASGCCASKAAVTAVSKTGSCVKSCTATCSSAGVVAAANQGCNFGKCSAATLAASRNNQALGNGYGMVMPAAFFVPASYTCADLTSAGCCRSGAANISGASSCGDKAKECCSKGVAVTPASNETTKSGCCSAKAACTKGEVASR